MAAYIIAHDLGTSGNKAVLYNESGEQVASHICEYPVFYPHPGYVEQNAEDWWHAVCEASRKLLQKTAVPAEDIACVSFSGQMMGCLPVDRQGNPLRRALIWADTRSVRQEQSIIRELGMERVYRITGHRASASYTAAKWLWVREHEAGIADRTYRLLQAKDFIVHRLTGVFATDYSDASGTNLLDLEQKIWSPELLKALSIPADLLPNVFPSTYIAGKVTRAAAAACGLREGTPVVLGGGDGSCATVGAGAVAPGQAYCVLGTSAWISAVASQPFFDPEMRTFTWVHLDPSLYTPCGTMQAAGASVQWLGETLASTYDVLNNDAQQAAPGAGGVLFLPYLLGERSPRWDAEARGAFVGLSQTTERGELTRAVMEGVAMNLKIILDTLQKHMPLQELTVIGGGASSRVWRQILADVWSRSFRLTACSREATCLGAAVCGGVGVGLLEGFQDVLKWNRPVETVVPGKHAELYDQLFPIFDETYESLKQVNHRLYMLQNHT